MKDYLKNPNVYYILAPALVAIWALTAGFVFYPNSVRAWEDEKDEYEKTLGYIQQIIEIQPQRLKYKGNAGNTGEFDFSETVTTFTRIFKIPSSNYSLNVRKEVKKAGKNARSASMTLKDVDVETVARFLSALLTGWPELKCELLGLEKSKAGKNKWNVDLQLTYYTDVKKTR